jgi:3-hydroxyacyl-CoA dehydrogenase
MRKLILIRTRFCKLTLSRVVEAIRMAERGDASPQDIDTAMELGAGYREFTGDVINADS